VLKIQRCSASTAVVMAITVLCILYVYWSQVEKFFKLFPDAEQLCALLCSKYMRIVVVCRKFRGVQRPQL